MLRRTLSFVVVLFIIGVVGYTWYAWQRRAHQLPKLHNQAIAVRVAKVTTAIIPNHLDTVGTLQAKQMTNISADISGKIAAIFLSSG